MGFRDGWDSEMKEKEDETRQARQPLRQPMEKILVVEDDRTVQNALKRLFAANGYNVEIARTGPAGLESVRAGLPAAVVLDLRLPGMPGQDVCREIKNTAPALPVIVLSASTD